MDIKPGWKGGTRITFDGKGALRTACIATRNSTCSGGMQQALMDGIMRTCTCEFGVTCSKHRQP